MRILFCNKYNFPFSGTEVYMFELMDLMKARGHEVALFSMADSRGPATPYDQHFLPNIDYEACQSRGIWVLSPTAAFAPAGLHEVERRHDGDWSALLLRRG